MRNSTVFYVSILILLAFFNYSDAQEAASGSDPEEIRTTLESVQGLKINENNADFVKDRLVMDDNTPVNLAAKRSTYDQHEMQVTSGESDPLPLPFSEGFEGDMLEWTALDIDGDGNTWDIYSSKPRTGERSAAVRWNTAGNDDWLISPLLAFPAGHNITLSFWASSGLSSFPETFEVAVINNGGDSYDIIATVVDIPAEYTQFTYDLSQYSGQDVNVAIICISVDQYYLHVDDFLVESEATNDPDPEPGDDTVTDIDGNVYKTVQIGSQVWMAENLKTTRYNDGESVFYPGADVDAWQGATNGAFAWYGNDDQYKEVYGALYNWYAVSTGLLCPAGWHAPENLEWTMLTDYLAAEGHGGDEATVLKAASGWDMSGNGTDLFEFSALPGGYRLGGGGYNNKEWHGYWWSSTEYHADNGVRRSMESSKSEIDGQFIGGWKAEGYSVRCMENSVPVITTREIENITHDAAISGGIILVNSGEAVTNRGVVWSTSENPSLNEGVHEGFTQDGAGTGVYSSNFGGLAAGTTYYVRAYATNSIGTGYGDQLSFTTEADPGSVPGPEYGTVADIDGNEYDTVMIGDQTWFVQNLRVTKFNNGDEIANVQNSADWGEVDPADKWAHYNNDQVNDDIYGKLYNGQVAIDSRNVCPDGWHVPSTDEWDILIDFLGGAEVAGNKLMATELWETPNNATNESGFTALPGGYRSSAGDFLSLIYSTEFSSSSVPNTWSSDYVYMHQDGTLYLQNSFGTGVGRYIRCVKDSEVEVTGPTVLTAIVTVGGQNAATGGGEVTDDGGDAVIARGVVWNTTENPTIGDNLGITQDGSGIGQFTSDITGLTAGTLYYVRAYATNSIGTAYGDQVSFTTTEDEIELIITEATGWVVQAEDYPGTMLDIHMPSISVGYAVGDAYLNGYYPLVYKTVDAGVSWEVLERAPSESNWTYLGVYFLDDNTGFISGGYNYNGAIYKTVDGGDNWVMVKDAGNKVHSIFFVNASIGYASAIDGKILKTVDGGDNWDFLTTDTNLDLYDISFVDTETGWIVGEDGIVLKTTNGGDTWETQTLPGSMILVANSVSAISLEIAYVQTLSKVFKTMDGGETWTDLEGLPASSTLSDLYFVDAERGWSVSSSPGAGICYTDDGGTNWINQPVDDEEIQLFSIYMYNDTIGCAAGNNVVRSTNGGYTPALSTVTTVEVIDVTRTTATGGGEVTDDGGEAVTVRGVVWNTSENPTIGDNLGITQDGSGIGQFTSDITGLTASTLYYVRAYATNSIGTAYGDQVSFTTEDDTDPDEGTVIDAEGNVYQTVTIGGQVWMAENLKTTKFNDGNDISMVTGDTDWSNLTTPGLSWYDNDVEANKDMYGALYNWYAVESGNICPVGWHVPTDDEWTVLVEYLGDDPGRQLKSSGGWSLSNGNDDYGFAAPPGGMRRSSGTYQNATHQGRWYTSTSWSSSRAWFREMHRDHYDVDRSTEDMKFGFSVRCLKDADPPEITTFEVTGITSAVAYSGGNILSDGGAPLTARGLVWSVNENPTVEENDGFTSGGDEEPGEFTDRMTGLNPGTTYYVRAYAKNSSNVGYGEQVMFETLEEGSVTDIEGNVYRTVIIGDQVWMAENLRTTTYNDGSDIELRESSWPTSDPVYSWYDNDPANKEPYGALYNWHAVNTGKLCPTGWIVPEALDWILLDEYIGADAGIKLKSVDGWGDEGNGTDAFGFSALPAGLRSSVDGAFVQMGTQGNWWTATTNSSTAATSRYITREGVDLITIAGNNKREGLSVRCIMDPDFVASEPVLTTIAIADITQTGAQAGGNITSDGGSTVTARGVVWSTTENPTIEDNLGISQDGDGMGEFTSDITGLDAETTYYVRAYATNSIGTGYGDQVNFTTVVTGSEILSGSKLTVYPNPVRDRLTVENSNEIQRIIIRNLSGQIVAEIYEPGSRQLTLDVNHLVKGVYIMTVVDVTGEQSVLKLVK